MKKFFKNLPLRSKIIAITLSISIITTAVGFYAGYLFNLKTYKNKLIETSNEDAKLISDFLAIPIEFDSPKKAREVLEKLQSKTHIANCLVFLPNDSLFTSVHFQKDTIVNISTELKKKQIALDDIYIQVYKPIVYKEKEYGYLYLRAKSNVWELQKSYLLTALVLMILMGTIAFILAHFWQKPIVNPIKLLAETMTGISESKDYSLRISEQSKDETGKLYLAFNQMLDTIQLHEKERNNALQALKENEKELIKAKERAEESERNILLRNEEYESLNEELRQSNEELSIAKEHAEENEKKIRRSERELKKAQEITHIGSWYLDLATNQVVWTEELYKMYNFDPTQPVPPYTEHMKLFTPESWDVLSASLAKTRETGVPYELELKTVKKDGTNGWMWVRGEAIKDENDEIIGLWGAAQDITERKHAENELIKAKEKAVESNQLKTAFLQNMSHEIRTPMNAIIGFSGFLNKPGLTPDKQKSYVSIIQNSSQQLLSIVTDILTMSSIETKQEKLNIGIVSINDIIIDLLAIFKQQAQNQNISLYAKQHLNEKQSEIYTDKTKVTQILTNLLTNSLKFTHEGFIEFGYTLKNNEIEFYVKDSGIGIKPEFHEAIFERFRQADKSINKLYGGTGLGLAISKAFAELMGGKIWVQSEPEKGSTFYFTIPYKPVIAIDVNALPLKQHKNTKTVLVAEDEEYNYLYIEELLLELDLNIIHAKNGRETVEIFKENANIDLILMDIKMPIMTGHQAAMIIKEIKSEMPIIAQSAYALEHERAKYEGIFDDYLAKPINQDDLKRIVAKYIDFK